MASEQRDEVMEIRRLFGFAHARQIDRHGLVVEQARRRPGALIEFMSEHVEVGRHQDDGNQRQRGAPQLKDCSDGFARRDGNAVRSLQACNSIGTTREFIARTLC
jgi:hypothetical protein